MLPGGRSYVCAKLATLYYFRPCAKLATLPEKYRTLGLAFMPSDVL